MGNNVGPSIYTKKAKQNKNNSVLMGGYCQYLIDKGRQLLWATAVGNLELEI